MIKKLNSYQEMKGVSFIEFALIFPIFLSVLFTTIQICLVFIDKASIDYITEELLLSYATDDEIPDTDDSGKIDGTGADRLQELWEDRLRSAQIKSTNPKILAELCVPNDLTSLKDFEIDQKENILMSFDVSVPINCLMGQLTFGLTDSICLHKKKYFRLMPLDITDNRFNKTCLVDERS